MPFTAPSLNVPDNCFVQFIAAHTILSSHGAGSDDCTILLQECLPAYSTADIMFQLFLDDVGSAPDDDVYYLRLISDCEDDSVIDIFGDDSKYGTIQWVYEASGSRAVGFITLTNDSYVFKSSAALDAGDCFKIGIFSNATKYTYGSFAGTSYPTTSIEIIIDGSPVSGPMGATELQGIADALTL